MASQQKMLAPAKIIAFVSTQMPAEAKVFYRDALGLRLLSEDAFALVFDAGGVMLRVSIVPQLSVAPYTVLGWQVEDIVTSAIALGNAGVKCERYPGMDQDSLGIWNAPGGAKVAWFKDPDGNTLSLTQF